MNVHYSLSDCFMFEFSQRKVNKNKNIFEQKLPDCGSCRKEWFVHLANTSLDKQRLTGHHFTSSFKWRVTVSGELMFSESYGNCDVTNTLTLRLRRHKTISHYDF